MVSHGSKLPIAANEIPKERLKNIRVELSPYWFFSDPKILITSTLDPDNNVALSPDGRTLAIGSEPLQLWDADLKIKLKDLGVAGDYIEFCPDGRFIATIVNTYVENVVSQSVLKIYDCKTGSLFDQIPWEHQILDLAWNQYSSQLAFTTADGFLVKYDLAQKKKTTINKIRYDGRLAKGLVWTKDDKYLINGFAAEKELSVWDSKDFSLVKQLVGTYWPHALAQSNDGKLLFAASNQRFLSIWDLETWKVSHMVIPVLSDQIQVHPFKPIILMNDWGAGNKNEVVEINYSTRQILSTRMVGEEGVHYAYSPDGESIYAALADTLKVFNAANLKTKSKFEGLSYKAIGSESDTTNNLFLSYDLSGIYAWDVTSGIKKNTWNIKVDHLHKLFNRESEFLVSSEKNDSTYIYRLNSKDFTHQLLGVLGHKVDLVRSTDSLIVLACKQFIRPNTGNDSGFLEIYNNNFRQLRRIDIPLVTAELQHGDLTGSGFQALAIGPDQQKAAISTYWLDGFKLGTTISSRVDVYNLYTGAITDSFFLNAQIHGLSYNKNGALLFSTVHGSYGMDQPSAEPYFESTRLPEEHELNIESVRAKILWGKDFLTISKDGTPIKQLTFPDDLVGVQVFESKNLLLTLTTTNEITFYDLRGFDNRLTIVPKMENEWIAYTPQGNFQASLFGSEKAFWSYGDNYIEFSQLRNEFENTQLITSELNAIRRNNYPSRPGIDQNVLKNLTLSDVFKITSKKAFDTTGNSYDLEFSFDPDKLQGYDTNGWKVEINFQNGLIGVKGATERIDIDSLKKNRGGIGYYKKSYDLEDGFNNFFLSLLAPDDYTKYVFRDNIVINREGAIGDQSLPNLYFFGIAIDKYADTGFNTLSYTVNDVRDVAGVLKKQEHVMYQTVDTQFVLNEQVNNLGDYLTRFFRRVKARKSQKDIVVFYLSGHGTVQGSQLYFVCADKKEDDSPPGQPLNVITDPLSQVSNLIKDQKIVFLDFCRSGYLRSYQDADELIVPSCGMTDASIETMNRGRLNGIFTRALLDGLSGEADRKSIPELVQFGQDFGNGDGKVDLDELVRYIQKRVAKETNKVQYPPLPNVKKNYAFVKIITP